MNKRFDQLLKDIENCQTEEDVDNVRAAVDAYKRQKGGFDVEMFHELSFKLFSKLNDINNDSL